MTAVMPIDMTLYSYKGKHNMSTTSTSPHDMSRNRREFDDLRSQSVTSSWGGRCYLPYALDSTNKAINTMITKMKMMTIRKNLEGLGVDK